MRNLDDGRCSKAKQDHHPVASRPHLTFVEWLRTRIARIFFVGWTDVSDYQQHVRSLDHNGQYVHFLSHTASLEDYVLGAYLARYLLRKMLSAHSKYVYPSCDNSLRDRVALLAQP